MTTGGGREVELIKAEGSHGASLPRKKTCHVRAAGRPGGMARTRWWKEDWEGWEDWP